MREAFERIAGSKEIPTLSYESSPNTADGMNEAQIRSRFRAELNKRSTEERRLGTTLVGPHRDELGFQINALDLRGFASQGQHKTFLVALKLAEFAYLKERCHETPILLLDDVLSELDDTRAARLLAEAESAGQTFITSTDGRPFKQQDQYKRFWVSAGIVREYEEARENAAAR
jgi:DNA replication and repair protein RecF